MKAALLLFAMWLVVSACVSTSSKAHNYTPTASPELAGLWVGSGGGQTQHMLVRPNGTGELCWETMGNYKSTPVVISGDKIVTFSAANFKRNADGTISSCIIGMCMNFKRTE